jgi:hypothetical protein
VRIEGTVSLPPGVRLSNVEVHDEADQTGRDTISVEHQRNARFRVERVRPGNYWITAKGGSDETATRRPDATKQLFWAAVRLSVSDQDVSGLVLTLQPAANVSGRVTVEADPGGPAFDVAKVFLSLVPLPGTLTAERDVPEIPVSSDGRFSASNMTPGRYRLVARSVVNGALLRISSLRGSGTSGGDPDIDVGTAAIADLAVGVMARPR